MSNTASNLVSTRMTREDYRVWLEAQPKGRFERIDGHVVAMAPQRIAHLRIKRNILIAMVRAIRAADLPCEAFPDGATVEVEDGDYEPDASVVCGERTSPDVTVAPDPIIVVEVLSPSTQANDKTWKLVGYFTLPSIRHYLILFPDRPRLIHHRRRDDGDGIETRIVTAGAIVLDPPGMTITMDEIYGG